MQEFSMYGHDGASGIFSTTLPVQMEDGTYRYYACCPKPASVSGTSVGFIIPPVQNGRGSSDVMISGPVSHGPLIPAPIPENGGGLTLGMRHMTHVLDFFLVDSEGLLEGEEVKSFEVNFPRSVTGRVDVELPDGTSMVSPDGNTQLEITLENGLKATTGNSRNYATAAILPFQSEEGDEITLTLHTENKMATTEPIQLRGRNFLAGHATPVKIVPSGISQVYNAYFNIAENHLGEDITRISISGPEGCRFGDSGTNTWTFIPDKPLAKGDRFALTYTNEDDFRSIAGKDVTIEFESENAVVISTATISDEAGTSCSSGLVVPYLYFEDFSGTVSSNEYDSVQGTGSTSGGSNTSVDLSARGWPSGWYGARCGINAGDKVRLTTRSESVNVLIKWSGSYNGRIDSPAMTNIKENSSGVKLRISFDFSSGWNGSKNNVVNFYLAVGTHTKAGAINSVGSLNNIGRAMDAESIISEDIEFTPGPEQILDSTYPATANSFSCVTPQLCFNNSRITWETYSKIASGDGYYNYWVFLDNIRISIEH